jgi:hypothetical protein
MASITRRLLAPLALAAASCSSGAQGPAGEAGALKLERKIALPDTVGRIDHLAYDPTARRLFVAELGNGSVDAVDLASGRVAGRISGLDRPQGVAWIAASRQLAIASQDGSLGFYDAALRPLAILKLGEDADNLHVDRTSGMLIVGFGSGALAAVNPASRRIVGRLVLPGHPEGFTVEGGKAYVNVPDSGEIAVGEIGSSRTIARWPTGRLRQNFPMALEPGGRRLAVGFRQPARLAILDAASGRILQDLPACGDSDDLFFASGDLLVMICGSGEVDLFRARAGVYAPAGRARTRPGARTGLLVPDGRLVVAARSASGEGAELLVFLGPASGSAGR